MTFSIVDSAMSSVTDLLINALCKGIKGGVEERSIRSTFNEYSRKYFREKYELLQLREEFDFCFLNEWIESQLEYILTVECEPYGIRTHYEMQLIERACQVVFKDDKLDPRSRNIQVSIYLKGIFCLLRNHLVSKVSSNDKIFGSILSDDINAEIKKTAFVIAARIQTDISYKGSFEEIIDNIEFCNLSIPRFSFRNHNIGFYGRLKECSALDRFLDVPQKVLYWAITGIGGTGKSKLIYEYAKRRSEDPEWKICFLEEKHIIDITRLNSWDYPRNLFLVIDNSGRYEAILSKWFLSLQSKRLNKLRVLLVEIQEVKNESSIYAIESFWYRDLHSGMVANHDLCYRILQYEYCDIDYSKFLTLGNLSQDALLLMIDDFTKSIGKPLLGNDVKRNIIRHAYELDCLHIDNENIEARPLLVLYILDAVLNNRAYDQWDISALMGYVIKSRKDCWLETVFKKNFELYAAFEKILVYTTATKHWTIGENLETPLSECTLILNRLPRNEVLGLVYAMFDTVAGEADVFNGIVPSLFGEFLILDYFSQHIHSSSGKEFADYLFRVRDKDQDTPLFISYLFRCIEHFEHVLEYKTIIRVLLERLDTQSLTNIEASYLAYAYVLLFKTDGDKKEWEYFHSMCWEFINKWPYDKRLNDVYRVCFISVLEDKIFSSDEMKQRLLDLRKMNANEELVDTLHAVIIGNDANEQPISDELYATIKKLTNKWPSSGIIFAVFIQVAVSYIANNNLDELIPVAKYIREGVMQWPDVYEINSYYFRFFMNFLCNLGIEYCNQIIPELNRILEKWPDDYLLWEAYSTGIFNLSTCTDFTGGTEEIRAFDYMLEKWPSSREIAENYALFIFNCTCMVDTCESEFLIDKFFKIMRRWSEDQIITHRCILGIINITAEQNPINATKTLEELGEYLNANNVEESNYTIYLDRLSWLKVQQSENVNEAHSLECNS